MILPRPSASLARERAIAAGLIRTPTQQHMGYYETLPQRRGRTTPVVPEFGQPWSQADVFGGEQWYFECARRQGFPDLDAALRFARGLQPIRGLKPYVYLCEWCDQYHVRLRPLGKT